MSSCKILWKNENALVWDKKCLIWVFLGWNLIIALSYLKLAHTNLSNLKILRKKKKWPKMPYLVYFWARILKNYCHVWNQHPRICLKRVFKSCSEFWYRALFLWDPLFLEVCVRVRARFVKYVVVIVLICYSKHSTAGFRKNHMSYFP